MQDSLYEFLIINKKLSLPGIGTISLKQNSSQLDFTNRQLNSPSFYFIFDHENDTPSKKLFDWLSSAKGVSEWDAIKSVNDFSFALKNRISQAGEANWNGVGVLKRDKTGKLKLDPHKIALQTEQPVHAEKVIREKFEHTVLVGEREKSSVEMAEYFAGDAPKKNYAWIMAIVLTILAVMFIGWYFSEKGFNPSSAGNNSVIKSN
ncbi:MAG TPA: hypothetical protein VFT15_16970 [Chitinophagaceae bacterium]|nr:hypothetical protein [Chitinophagaceae bacterium]